MKVTTSIALAALLALAAPLPSRAAEGKLVVIAAENFYGDIARQIGGDLVEVTSIMSNPDQDPHLFELSPAVARQLTDAQIVIYNGADYDPWMEKLLSAAPRPGRAAIVVSDLTGKKAGDNPHLWYDPNTAPKLAKALSDAFQQSRRLPCHRLCRPAVDISRLAQTAQ